LLFAGKGWESDSEEDRHQAGTSPSYSQFSCRIQLGVDATAERRCEHRQTAPLDTAILFAADLAVIRRSLPKLADKLAPGGMLWISWSKMSSGVKTDL
jgi:hypothetical protein